MSIPITVPVLHSGQVDIWKNRSQFNVVCCGRRWGKTKLMVCLSANAAMKDRKVGLFTPNYRQLGEPFEELHTILNPAIRRSSKTEGTIRLDTGGLIDFWATNDNYLAGRGREYHLGAMDEAAFSKNTQMLEIWQRSIKPTLLTTRGSFWLFSTPNGVDPENFFYRAWHDADLGFKRFHAPTSSNPYVPLDELEKEKKVVHPLVFQQEFEAKFIDFGNATFFKLEYFLDENQLPVEYPTKCDAVFAVMDCAVKSGSTNDATAVLYCATSKYHGHPLVWLDYEMHSIEAASLEYLAPKVLKRCEELAKQCGARSGSLGLMVEDAAGGQVLIQQAGPRGWPVQAIDSLLTSKGKDERALLSGGPAYRGDAKISKYCFDKTYEWRGRTANHLLQQLTLFRIGDKEAYRRADDLLDCAAYSIIVSCADSRTF